MTLRLDLPADLAERLKLAAEKQGLSADGYTLHLLKTHLPPSDRGTELVALLQSWIDSPEGEDQAETDFDLLAALDEDRLSDRKLYPENLKGVTW
jgi:hypothetical protein